MEKSKLWLLSLPIGFLLIFWGTSLMPYTEDEKIRGLGLGSVPIEVARRHITIVEEMPRIPVRDDLVPVHIMYREDERFPWKLAGSGTYLKNYAPKIVTAYHIFGDREGRFGYRFMSKKEFSGKEPIFPIFGMTNRLLDDAIMVMGGIGDNFPYLKLPKFRSWNEKITIDKTLRKAFGNLKLLTSSQKPIPLSFGFDVSPGCRYAFFKYDVVAGESGTGAIIDRLETNGLFVVVRRFDGNLSFESTNAFFKGNWGAGLIIDFTKN